MSVKLYKANESKSIDCLYGEISIHKFDPPIQYGTIEFDNGDIMIADLPVISCKHSKRIKDDCILYEGNVKNCGWINEGKAMLVDCGCQSKGKVCGRCKKTIVEGEITC